MERWVIVTLKNEFLELSKNEEERAQELHRKSIVVDGLQASVFTDQYFGTVRDAGVTAASPTVGGFEDARGTIEHIADWYSKTQKHSDKALLATTVEDILRAKKEKKVAYIMNFQNTTMLGNNTDLVEVFYRLGVRQVQLTYQEKNFVGDGCGERTDCGLSHFGLQVIERMNKLGMLTDVSHVGDKTSTEAIELAEYPVCSHSNVRSVNKNVRNKDDDTIKALAEKGSLIGVVGHPAFTKWTRVEIGENPTVNDVLDHVDYIVKLVGVDHVGLGLDIIDNSPPRRFDNQLLRPDVWGPPPRGYLEGGPWTQVTGLGHVSEIINIARGLVHRGYSDEEIQKIIGLNWLRVYKNVFGK
jgi:membrane dipeptidase